MITLAKPAHDTGQTYEQMAPYYDELTAHHDYELYVGSLLPVARSLGLTGKRLLDLGCGTGKSYLPLLRRGWEIAGCDISPAMLARAREKSPGVRLERVDMRALPRLGAFDLVWSLGDGLNYLLSAHELELAFSGFRRNLGPNGLALFDLNTALTYRTFYAEKRVDELRGRRLIWRGGVDGVWSEGELARATMSVEDPDTGLTKRAFEHRQRHFPIPEVQGCLERAGLRTLGVWGLGFDAVLQQPLDESQHTKALVIAARGEVGANC